MRKLALLALTFSLCIGWSRTSAAGEITLNLLCGVQDIVTGSGSLSLDLPCSTAEGTGDAAATVDTTSGLSFGARASWTSATTPGSGAAQGAAEVADSVTLVGEPEGTDGFLQLVFATEGSCSLSFPSASPLAASCSFINFSLNTEIETFVEANGKDLQLAGPGTVTLDVPLTFGVPSSLNLQFVASVELFDPSDAMSLSSNFFDTATLTDFSVLDSSSNPVPDGSVISADGLFQSAAVPEPASLMLIGTGIGLLVARRGWKPTSAK